MLGVSPNTVTRWAREGRLPCQVTLGGHHRFDRELVEQLRKSLYRAGGRADVTLSVRRDDIPEPVRAYRHGFLRNRPGAAPGSRRQED